MALGERSHDLLEGGVANDTSDPAIASTASASAVYGAVGRRKVLVSGAIVSAILLVCTLGAFVLQEGGISSSSTELAGKYNYGMYNGLAPDAIHDRMVRDHPNSLVYYNVFTGKAVKPHRWLSNEDYKGVLRKAMDIISKIKGQEAQQAEINDNFIQKSGDLNRQLIRIKQEAVTAKQTLERDLRTKIVAGVAQAERDGFRKLDLQKAAITAAIDRNTQDLVKLLDDAEASTGTRLDGLRNLVQQTEAYSNQTIREERGRVRQAEQNLTDADEYDKKMLAQLQTRIDSASSELTQDTDALAQDLLKAKLALSAEVDRDVAKMRTKLHVMILEVRVLIIRFLRASQQTSRSRLGNAAADLNTKYARLKSAVAASAATEAAFGEGLRVRQEKSKVESARLLKSATDGRLAILKGQLQAMVDQISKTIEKLRSEQQAGALFLQKAVDDSLGGVQAMLDKEQNGDAEAMAQARKMLARAEEAMALAMQGSFWQQRDASMVDLRSGLNALNSALSSIDKLRAKATSDRDAAIRGAERSITHGYVAQYWWLYGPGAALPSLYAAPDRQVILGVIGMNGALPGQGRQQAGRNGLPVGESVGVAARFFGLFDAALPGDYDFFLTSTGVARLWVDGRLVAVLTAAADPSGQAREAKNTLRLDAGPHRLWVEHASTLGTGDVSVEWAGPSLVRQQLNGWHSAAEPGWQLQLYFWDSELDKMPVLRGVQGDREGVTTVIDYSGWGDWNRALEQKAIMPASQSVVNKLQMMALDRISSSSDCVDVSRSPMQAIDGVGATCDQGVLSSFNLVGQDCAGQGSGRANFTCVDIPVGACVERLGPCQPLESTMIWDAKCGDQESLASVRIHHIGCGEGQRRMAWKCCGVSGGAYQKARTMPDNGNTCENKVDGAVSVKTECAQMQALESLSLTQDGCQDGGMKVTSICADIPQEQMPIGRVAANFWGFVKTASDQSVEIGIESAGGSKLLLNGRVLLDNDGLHAKQEVSGRVTLPRGNHLVSAQWFQDKGPEVLRVWSRFGGDATAPQQPLKVWHFAPPVVPDDLQGAHLAGGVLLFLGRKESYVQQDNFVRMPPTSFTAAMWMLAAEGPQGDNGVLLSYRKEGGPLLVELRKSASITAEVLGVVVDSGISVADGAWHHVAITWEAQEGRLVIYIEGSPVLVQLGVAQGGSIANGGCLAFGQRVLISGCGQYLDAGSFKGNAADMIVGGSAWNGARVRAAYLQSDWTSSDSVADIVLAVTRRQPAPKAYIQGTARALCALDVAPLSDWKSLQKPCVETLNVQWRSPLTLDREQQSRNRGAPRVVQLTGYGRAAVVRPRYTRMPSNALTVSLWVKVSEGGHDGIMLSYGDASSPKALLELANPSEVLASILGSDVPSMLTVADQQWHHLAFTWESETGEARIYIDGNGLLRQPDVAKGKVMPNGGCLAIGVTFRAVGTVGEALAVLASQEGAESGLVAQMSDILIFNRLLPLGYLRASMHSEMSNRIGRQWLRLAITNEQYGDVAWLPERPREVRTMNVRTCALNGGLRSVFMSAGTYKGLSECRFKCPLLVGDFLVLRTLDKSSSLEVHVRMVGVAGAQLSFPDAIGVRYLTESVTLAGAATAPFKPYYIMNGATIDRFPSVSRGGIRVVCVSGDMPGCQRNTSRSTLFQIYSPDGSLVSFWSLNGLWGGYEVQLPLNCYSGQVEGLAGTMSIDAADFAKGGSGTLFTDLDGKCAAKGPLATQLDGTFDGSSDSKTIAKWCSSWSITAAGYKPIMFNRRAQVTIEAPFSGVPKPAALVPPTPAAAGAAAVVATTTTTTTAPETCDALQDRPVWFEACQFANAQWGTQVGATSLFLAKGVTQELRSVKPDGKTIRDSSGNGQDLEGRGVELGGDGAGLIAAKRTDPLDIGLYVPFPERLSLWTFTAQSSDTCAAKDGRVCWSLERDTCKASPICQYMDDCGCIPWDCKCGDYACINKGGSGLARTGPEGWCSRWFFNPLGGPEISSMPDLRKLSPQKAAVVDSVDFLRDSDFSDVAGLTNFDRVAVTVDGTLSITTAGMYTVCVTSDDGSHVYVDGGDIAAAPGLHPPQTGCGSRFLSRGDHSVYSTFFENGGGAYFKITYKGPDTKGAEVLMPSVGFDGTCSADQPTCPDGPGWCGMFYYDPNGLDQVRSFPDVSKLTAQVAKTMMTIGFDEEWSIASMIGKAGSYDRVVAVFVGVLHVNKAGEYTVCTTSDDGSDVYIDGKNIASAPGLHPPIKRCGRVQLDSDDHNVKVEFFENLGGAAIKVTYSGPDTNGQEILMPSARHTRMEEDDDTDDSTEAASPAPTGANPSTTTTTTTTSVAVVSATSGGGGQCQALKRLPCKAVKSCFYTTNCGCIPFGCDCGDFTCIKNGGKGIPVASGLLTAAKVKEVTKAVEQGGQQGWCSKWYYNPLGGAGISSMPDLARLNPQKAVVLSRIELVRDADFSAVTGIANFDRVAMTIEGTLSVSKAGEYTVCITSDDGSHVYMDGGEIAAAPGLHPPQTGCGSRYLSPGDHSVFATFFENGGGAYLKITYKGPDTDGTEIVMPSTGFDGMCEAPVQKCLCGTGWCGLFFFDPYGPDDIRTYPDVSKLVPQAARRTLTIGYENDWQINSMLGKAGSFDHVAAEFRGVLHINAGGDYRVCTNSDDGSRVLVNGQSVAAAPGLHPPLRNCGTIRLPTGDHNVKVEYFENGGGAVIVVTYAGPDTGGREVLMPAASHPCTDESQKPQLSANNPPANGAAAVSNAVAVAVAGATPLESSGIKGWCSRWFLNPLGGAGISSMPDVRRLNPQKAIVIPSVQFVRDADFTAISGVANFDRVAVTVDGFLQISTAGDYTVCVTSDDGSHVYVDGLEMAAAPGLHPPQTGCGSRFLSPGNHVVFGTFFENGGGAFFRITYKGPDTKGAEVVMPSSGFEGECVAVVQACACGSGWCGRFYFDPNGLGDILNFPDTSKLVPQDARTFMTVDMMSAEQLDASIGKAGSFDRVAVDFRGVLHINQAGEYSVCTLSDDGSRVYVDGESVAAAPGLHPPVKNCGIAKLMSGDHDVKVEFFQNMGGAAIKVTYSGPDTNGQERLMPSASHPCEAIATKVNILPAPATGAQCSSMKRTQCKEQKDVCTYTTNCGCIPIGCGCSDSECIRKGGNGNSVATVTPTTATTRTGPKGWCSRWYYNPNGGGQITTMPDFRRLSPQNAFILPSINLVRDADFTAVSGIANFDRVAMTVDGVLQVTEAGEYTVCVTSDDGAHVFMDGGEIAAAPGLHPPQTGCGKRFLSPGEHSLFATFFENGGGAFFKITYKGPDTGFNEVLLPSIGFDGECSVTQVLCTCGAGWCGRFFYDPNGLDEVRTFPDLSLLNAQIARPMMRVDFTSDSQISSLLGKIGNFDRVAAEFLGLLHVNVAGEYTMCTNSDDGSRLSVDGKIVTDNGGLHPPVKRCSKTQLDKGDHDVRVEFFENGGGSTIVVTYSGPDTNGQEVFMPSSRRACRSGDGEDEDDDSSVQAKGDASQCAGLSRATCIANDDTCDYYTQCGCLPLGCTCGDDECVDKATNPDSEDNDSSNDETEPPLPPAYIGKQPEGWSFLPNDRIRLNGSPSSWALALRREEDEVRKLRVRVRAEDVHVARSLVGVAFHATDVDNLEAVVFRRATRGMYAFAYHLVRRQGREKWSQAAKVYLPSSREWFEVTVDTLRRAVFVNRRRIKLSLGFPQVVGTNVGVIGKGRDWAWEWMRIRETVAPVFALSEVPVGSVISLASLHRYNMYVRARGESTGLFVVQIVSADVTTVEPNPTLSVSLSVGGRTFRTRGLAGSTTPQWGESFEAPLTCRALSDAVVVTLFGNDKSLGQDSFFVRTVEGAENELKLRIQGSGAGAEIKIKARFDCLSMGVQASVIADTSSSSSTDSSSPASQQAREASFRLVPGLSDPTMLSFESVAFPSFFLARDKGALRLARFPSRSSIEPGLVLHVFEIADQKVAARALAGDWNTIDSLGQGSMTLIDGISFPAPLGLLAYKPDTSLRDDDNDASSAVKTIVGVVRGMIDAKDSGQFTLTLTRGDAILFVDGEQVAKPGQVTLVKGLHDIVMVAGVSAEGRGLEVQWEGPLTALSVVSGYHSASLPASGSMQGFMRAATFNPTVGEAARAGSVQLQTPSKNGRAIRLKGTAGDVWVCSLAGHMKQLRNGLRTRFYFLKKTVSTEEMPRWDYIEPSVKGFATALAFTTSDAMERSINGRKCDNVVVAPTSSAVSVVALSPAAACVTMKRTPCKQNKDTCIYHTHCGCIPLTCSCGDYDCIKAGGKKPGQRTSSVQSLALVNSGNEDESEMLSDATGVDKSTSKLAAAAAPKGWCSRWYLNPLGGAGISSMPDLRKLNPQKALVVPQVRFVRDADFTAVSGIANFDRVAMTLDGILAIVQAGDYTVCVTSDDGSQVFVDGMEMAARPGLHPPETGCGTRFLSPGQHSVLASFFENGGGAYMAITYKGPDTKGVEVPLPSTGFNGECVAPDVSCSCGSGWCARFYYDPNGLDEVRDFPDFSKLTPQFARTLISIGYMDDAAISSMIDKPGTLDRIAVEFRGVLHVNRAGEYTICSISDDGSRIYVDRKLVTDNGGLHPPTRKCGKTTLASGDVDVKVEFFENGGGAAIRVMYSGPDTNGQEILMPSADHPCNEKPQVDVAVLAAAGGSCPGMKRTQCKDQKGVCTYTTNCGCIPLGCGCGDFECIKNGGKTNSANKAIAVLPTQASSSSSNAAGLKGAALSDASPKGWCSRWFLNPLGGAGIASMPDLQRLNPQRAIVLSKVEFVRDADFTAVSGIANFDRVAVTVDGTLVVTTAGDYTVCVTSDDGAHVYMDGGEIAAAPGLHPPQTGCGSRYLSPGDHSVFATFFENGGGAFLKITYKGPDTKGAEVVMPSDGYEGQCIAVDQKCECGVGWCGRFYYDPNGLDEIRDYPKVSTLVAQKAKPLMSIDFMSDGQLSALLGKIGSFDRVAVEFTGVLHVNRGGEYTVCTLSDDGSSVYVDDKIVASAPGLHPPLRACGKVLLATGDHDVMVEYFENGGGAAIKVTYAGPDTNNQELLMPSTTHSCPKPVVPEPNGCPGGVDLPSTHVGMVARGLVEAPQDGQYQIKVSGSGFAQVWLDGQLICDKSASESEEVRPFVMQSGTHTLQLRWFQGKSALQSVVLKWALPGTSDFIDVEGKRWTSRQTESWRRQRSYEYRYRAAEQAGSFAFRRALYTPPGVVKPAINGRADDGVNIIPRGPDAVGPACGAYLMAPGGDDDARRKQLGVCKQEDEATRARNECEFVDEHGFCYRQPLQALCRAHRTQVRCMTSVPAPEYAACACSAGGCTCSDVPEKDHSTIMTPLPLETDLDVLAQESRDAWVHLTAERMLVARCRAQVRIAYVELLYRPADPTGLYKLTKRCLETYRDGNAVTALRAGIKSALPALSPYGVDEFAQWHTEREKVLRAFQDVLLRAPKDSFELHKYAIKFKQGASEDNVAAELGFSDEFDQLRKNVQDKRSRAEGVVRLIYREALMREPSADEFVKAVNTLLGAGKASEVKTSLLQGDECRRWCTERIAVRDAVRDVLLREPDTGSWEAYTRRLHMGYTIQRIRGMLSSSSERIHLTAQLDEDIATALSALSSEMDAIDMPSRSQGTLPLPAPLPSEEPPEVVPPMTRRMPRLPSAGDSQVQGGQVEGEQEGPWDGE